VLVPYWLVIMILLLLLSSKKLYISNLESKYSKHHKLHALFIFLSSDSFGLQKSYFCVSYFWWHHQNNGWRYQIILMKIKWFYGLTDQHTQIQVKNITQSWDKVPYSIRIIKSIKKQLFFYDHLSNHVDHAFPSY